MKKTNLVHRAEELELEAELLKQSGDQSYKSSIATSQMLNEANNLREWAEFGCLVGRPNSTWQP